MEYYSHTLPNGLRIVHKPAMGNVSYCGFFINAGTRDENEDEHGMAHFVEHMLFKGTHKRRSHHIINRMELVGGELNAYTNKEETVIYSIFLEQHFERSLELLTDITFHSVFPRHEIEKEIDVIIDEIHSYEDSPSELIFDEFENLLFRKSGIGHNILGTPESIQDFDTVKILSFFGKHYVPSNMVFFSYGKTDFKKIVRLAEKYITAVSSDCVNVRIIPPIIPSERVKEEKSTSQAHALIGCRAYSLFDPKRRVLQLLSNLLGGPGMNSRLNLSLREKRGLVYNVESSYTPYTDTGLLSIYFGCDKKHTEKCIALVDKEIQRLKNERLSTSQLSAVKKQFFGQIGVMSDNNENVALALGKNFMHYNHFNSLEEVFNDIEAITSDQIQDIANEIFEENRLFSLLYY
ncbi:putative Zn-dependent peptidase [Dysgonomonas hofstadii]|uniref:Putative Zn-dependent peptidase n=1 Tax=Dysgonomonas hofstadii TaxID=637886 RepID=A0A840CT58_9BACT|nr:pitrilysin family protein [Dysgonomonas hofstadii]MBB4035722.1 putative Zn-dependent peptidase [Dysgonomonas hofstadii]